MKQLTKQAVDFCTHCGGILHVIQQTQDDEGVWGDVTKCTVCKVVSGGREEKSTTHHASPGKGTTPGDTI